MPTRPEFNCPITQEIMANPVTTPCSHTFESTAIGGWIDSGHLTCPLCRAPISKPGLRPNTELKAQIARENGAVAEQSPRTPASTVAANPFPLSFGQHTNFSSAAPQQVSAAFAAPRPTPAAAPPRVPTAFTAPRPTPAAARQQVPAAFDAPSIEITPELLAAREWYRNARYELQNDPHGTFAALRESHRHAQANGTFDRMRREMAADRDGAFAALRASHQRAQADGTFDRMRREMTEDRDGTFTSLREQLRFMRG